MDIKPETETMPVSAEEEEDEDFTRSANTFRLIGIKPKKPVGK